MLEEILSQRQAKKTGVCSIKEEVFTNVFDEVIRQETINCPERGLMVTQVAFGQYIRVRAHCELARCRDQLKLTLMAYRTLSEFGTSQKFAHATTSCEEEFGKISEKRKQLEAKVSFFLFEKN